MGLAAAAAGAGRILGPIIMDAAGNLVRGKVEEAMNPSANQQQGQRASREFNTQPVTDARNENSDWASAKSAQQMAAEDNAFRQRDAYNMDARRREAEGDASLLNDVSNSNFGRAAALNAANTLNEQYATAGGRLNDAARNSQAAANTAMSTLAGIFR